MDTSERFESLGIAKVARNRQPFRWI